MTSELVVLLVTGLAGGLCVPILWYLRKLTTLRVVFVLFAVDIAMTIEAAFYSDLVLIAVLHVFTIPAFFALIYFDLVKQHRSYSRCFVCGNKVANHEAETVTRKIEGQPQEFLVHKSCISVQNDERKAFSSNLFKNGVSK